MKTANESGNEESKHSIKSSDDFKVQEECNPMQLLTLKELYDSTAKIDTGCINIERISPLILMRIRINEIS